MTDEKDVTKDDPGNYDVIHRFFIAGVQHHEMKNILEDLYEDDHLMLVPEPSNKYDPNAVRIEHLGMTDTTMCGYVPRKFSADVSACITLGMQLECVIVKLNKRAKPWEWCMVEIRQFPAPITAMPEEA